jgi:hypothetical protein
MLAGGPVDFKPYYSNINYQPVPIAPMTSYNPGDPVGELNAMISRLMQKRSGGMLT